MRILVASPLDTAAIECLKSSHDVTCSFGVMQAELKKLIQDREALVFRSGVTIDRELLESAPELRLIIRAGCGLDNIDLNVLRERNIQLVRIPEPAAKAVAELTLGLMINLARQVRRADLELRQGHWLKQKLVGHLLFGKILGIIGAGNIGGRVGAIGAAIGMAPLGCVEFPNAAAIDRLGAKGIRLASFDEVISVADFVCIHVPLKASTRNLIDAQVLSHMKAGAFLLNMARGGVVDETALFDALTRGKIAGAALDVHTSEGEGRISPFATLPNVLVTPHIGSMTSETQTEIGQRVVSILELEAKLPRVRPLTSAGAR
jgi:D-3-phosphoglycerate dehydrogenase